MIDILLATYNGERFIRKQIESILTQTYCDWKLIIQDDGSSDGTIKILQSYQDQYPDKIKIFLNKNNSGSCISNFLSLAQRSDSEYVMFCDQDDVWIDNKIEVTLREMKRLERETKDKKVALLVHTDLCVVDENLNLISKSLFKYQKMNRHGDKINNLLVQNIVTGCTIMCNRSLISLLNLVDIENQYIIMYDWWIGLIAATFGKIGFVNKPLVLYRQHGLNQVGAKKTESISYFVNKLLNLNQVLQRLDETHYQAAEFLNIYRKFLSEDNINIIEKYVNLNNYKKLKKLCILFKYDFFKYGFLRKVVQIFKTIFF